MNQAPTDKPQTNSSTPQPTTPVIPNPVPVASPPAQPIAHPQPSAPTLQPTIQATNNSSTPSINEPPPTDVLTDAAPNNKKMFFIIGGIILLLTLVAGGAFAYRQYSSSQTISLDDSHVAPSMPKPNIIDNNLDKQTDTPAEAEVSTEQPAPIRKENVGYKENIAGIETSLQNFLKKNCQAIDKIDYTFGLKLSQIPLTFDRTLHEIRPNNLGEDAICISSAPDKIEAGIVSLGLATNYLIYDDASEPLGGGGPPTIGEFGEEIYLKDNLRITAFLSRSHGGPMTTSDTYLNIRAIKDFKTLSGEEFHVVATKMVIEKGNASLLSILNQFSETDEKIIDQEYMNKEPEIIDKIVEEMSLLEKHNVLRLINQFKVINPNRFL